MCDHCGCGGGPATAVNLRTGKVTVIGHHHHDHDHHHDHGHGEEHVHADGTRHSHLHAEPGHVHGPAELVDLELRVLAKNDALAEQNRAWLAQRQILALNLMSAPGAGKTTLLEQTIRDMKNEMPISVIEGDQATSNDGERIRAAGADVVQVNTGAGCHLEADMIARGLTELDPQTGSLVVIENVGNLVCPALFDLGEHGRIVVFSATEGDDKPVKYPHMFSAADLVVINKIDLAPYLDFDLARAVDYARQVNMDVEVLALSARTGEGLDGWYGWLRARMSAPREPSVPHGGQRSAERP